MSDLVPLAPGIVLPGWWVRDFCVAGRGTLAPSAPPQELVVTGLYRVSGTPVRPTSASGRWLIVSGMDNGNARP